MLIITPFLKNIFKRFNCRYSEIFQNTPTFPRNLTGSEKSHIQGASGHTLQSSPLLPYFNSSTTENILKSDFDNTDDSKTETENGDSRRKDADDVKETGTNKTSLFLFSQKDDLKKKELKNPSNSIFNKSSSEIELAEKLDEKK